MKKYLICMVMCCVLAVTAPAVFALKFSFDVPEYLNVDMADTYACGEHTMIPLRNTAEDLGYEVIWNGDEKSVVVKNDNVSIKIRIGEDRYFVEAPDGIGMAVPAMVGAAPELKDSKTYVPAVMMSMLNYYNSRAAGA